MSRLDPRLGLMPSMLDRLIDPEADGSAWRRGYGMAQMVAAVQRDLEELLNTRANLVNVPEDCIEARRSVLGFGLPDLTSLEAISADQRAEIGHLLEQTIAHYEPRLKDIRATLLDPEEMVQRRLRFRVEARLNADPAPEVAFDTILELTTGRSSISRQE